MTKSGLKLVIKECLLEILSEGLGTSLNEVSAKKRQSESLNERKQQDVRMQTRKREMADNISYMTDDPIMRSVLSHTAATTLREQNAKELPTMANQHPGQGIDEGPGLDISSIFNKSWEDAAFGSKKS